MLPWRVENVFFELKSSVSFGKGSDFDLIVPLSNTKGPL